MYNYFMLMGRLTKDSETTELEDGRKVMNLNLAVQRPFRNTSGEYETDFFRISCWEFLAESYKDLLKKGMSIAVKGRLNLAVITNENGFEQTVPNLIGEKIMLFNSTKKQNLNNPTQEE